MEADLERILVDSIQLETENITLKQLVRFYNGKTDMQDQLKNMLHYNQQVTLYIKFFTLFCWIYENDQFSATDFNGDFLETAVCKKDTTGAGREQKPSRQDHQQKDCGAIQCGDHDR